PVTVEIIILVSIAILSHTAVIQNTNLIACSLLFAMGLQNALVTSISNSVVRTTHLTGLFTDLGIEISQLFFYKKEDEVKKLRSSVKLHLVIIISFFLGCIVGGYTYFIFGILSLFLPAICLISGLLYDSVKFRIVSFRRRYLN
ncbi:MAG TPA: YoaK family protein, partial [Ferruginibacter sp.]|nr:YoaK family protein [Ferruginibacter sp.]